MEEIGLLGRIRELQSKGLSYREIAKVLDISKSEVHRIANEDSSPAGTSHRDVSHEGNLGEIFREFENGATPLAVAQEYNLSAQRAEELFKDFKRLSATSPRMKIANLQEILDSIGDNFERSHVIHVGLRDWIERTNLRIDWLMTMIHYDGKTVQEIFNEQLETSKKERQHVHQ